MLDDDFATILRQYLRYLPADEPLPPAASLRDLGLDSMASVALMLDLEDRFAVSLPDSALTAQTFADPRSLWQALVAAGAVTGAP